MEWLGPRAGLRRRVALVITIAISIAAPTLAAAAPPTSRLDRAAALEIGRDARADRKQAPLQPREDGGFDYDDPKDRFSATITADGKVIFAPSRRIEPRACLVGSGCTPLARLGEYLLDASQWRSKTTPNQAGAALHGGADLGVPLPQNYSLAGRPGDGLPTPIMFGLGGSFGPPVLTDRIRAEFLGETFELRLRLAAKAERDRLSVALSVLEDRLLKIWSDRSQPLAARRELLFELWDECLDGVPPPALQRGEEDLAGPLEAVRQRAAAEARRRILHFIRARAPAGSAAAYTPDELRRFNARRRSAAPFAPYAAP